MDCKSIKPPSTFSSLPAECQQQLAVAVEKERDASERLMSSTTRLTALESQCSALRQEKSKNLAQLEMERAKVEMLEDAKNKYAKKNY